MVLILIYMLLFFEFMPSTSHYSQRRMSCRKDAWAERYTPKTPSAALDG